jgi:hypothetical protein
VLAAELMPLELGRPGTRDSTTMSLPAFAVAALAFFVGQQPAPDRPHPRPGHGARFELRLPLSAPTSRQPILANVASSR